LTEALSREIYIRTIFCKYGTISSLKCATGNGLKQEYVAIAPTINGAMAAGCIYGRKTGKMF